jgi:hypothetical protein
MAEEQQYGGYGATGYIPITKWNYVPFYKKNVFTGAAQADQAANLVTSPSFQRFWSGGGNQIDNTSLVRVDSVTRDYQATELRSSGKYNIDVTPQRVARPRIPTPPSGIRPIEFFNGMPRLSETGAFVPSEMHSVWPELDPQEQAWWDDAVKKRGEALHQAGRVNARVSDVPIEIRNIGGALVREDRQLLSLLNYHQDQYGTVRMVNASSPSNLLGVAAELGENANIGQGGRQFAPMHNRPNQIRYLTTQNPDVALSVANSRRVLEAGELLRVQGDAVAGSSFFYKDALNLSKYPQGIRPSPLLPATPFSDIPLVAKNPVGVPSVPLADEGRKVGRITRNTVRGVDKFGRPFTESLPETTTTVYGPPDKSAQWAARGKQALHIGGKTLAVIGGALEVANVPDRVKGYYMNALKNDPNWRPDASDKFGMSLFAGLEASANFATMGFYDQKDRIATDMTSGAGYGKGYYGTMVPPSGMTSVHNNPESRYERQGVSFNHVYPQAPR